MSCSTNTVSYSRLGVYLDCAEKYRLKYLASKETISPIIKQCITLEEPLIKGSLAHSMVEYILSGATKDDAIGMALRPWLEDNCKIEALEGNPENGEGINIFLLEQFAKEYGMLLARCSEGYWEEDKIRNGDGSLPKDPINYPPGPLKKEFNNRKLYDIKATLDNQAVLANQVFKRFSIANIVAEAASYAYIFELPEYIKSVKSVELNLAENPVGFYNDQFHWNGLLDTEYVTEQDTVMINDHKTEKTKRRPEDVAFDLQLNSYAAVRYEQTGKIPEHIAITHLRSNEVIVSNTAPYIMKLCMEYLEQIQEEIEIQKEKKGTERSWLKKWPGKYGSPCFGRDWKSGNLTKVCPYFIECHPEYYECIKDEVDDFFGLAQ